MAKEVKDDPKQVRVEDVIREETGEAVPVEVKIAEKKRQTTSISYTLRSFKANNDKLEYAGLLEEDEIKELELIYGKATQRWINNGMKLK